MLCIIIVTVQINDWREKNRAELRQSKVYKQLDLAANWIQSWKNMSYRKWGGKIGAQSLWMYIRRWPSMAQPEQMQLQIYKAINRINR